MSKKAVTDAVAARLAANWPTTPILSKNTALSAPADGGPWVRLEFPVTNDIQTILGRGYRSSGAFRIVVATEIASGLSKSNTWCEAIAAVFRNHRFDNVDCGTPSIREGIDDGNYFLASVIVPYFYDYTD